MCDDDAVEFPPAELRLAAGTYKLRGPARRFQVPYPCQIKTMCGTHSQSAKQLLGMHLLHFILQDDLHAGIKTLIF